MNAPLKLTDRKRQAIVEAAIAEFRSTGFESTSMDKIAATAGVSKRTVYNHFGDKENLFLAVVQRTFGRMIGLTDEILQRHLGDIRDQSAVEPALIAALLDVARTITVLPERAALIRLIIAEATRFPMLVQPWRDRGTVTDIISAQLSRLADRGLLTFDDPIQATQHLSALTLSQLNTRSLFGTLPLTEAEIEQVIRSGVHVYLLAYGPRP